MGVSCDEFEGQATKLFTAIEHRWLSSRSVSPSSLSGLIWALSGVYGPVGATERRVLWAKLEAVKDVWRAPWCITDDFNIVRFPSERWPESGLTNAMMEFSDFINRNALVDPPLVSGRFTWSNNQDHPSLSRLDRFLEIRGFDNLFLRMVQSVLPKPCSDHVPLLVDSEGLQYQKGPFRFENMWLMADGFVVKNWSKVKKAALLNNILLYDSKEDYGELAEKDRALREDLKKGFARLAEMEETYWRQKSKELWLKKCDRNTRYFHQMANAHYRRNFIGKLKVDGVVVDREEDIFTAIVEFYSGLLKEQEDWRPLMDGMLFYVISEEDVTALERGWGELKFWRLSRVAMVTKPQIYWEVVKGDVLGALNQFFHDCRWERSINATFLVLIPKKGDAVELKDFRPISLVEAIYKILAKLLAIRLSRVVNKVVGLFQNTFVGGRQILDGALVANECVDSRLRSEVPSLICKLDIEKAHDHVNWCFLLYLLKRMGFKEKWGNWMGWCIKTASFSVMVNGNPQGFFPSSRAKWLWRYAVEDGPLWKNVIEWKFGNSESGWWSKAPRGPYGYGVWQAIRGSVEEFMKQVHFKLSDGQRVRFWLDCWCTNSLLALQFPQIFLIARNKEVWVANYMAWDMRDRLVWNVDLVRDFHDSKLDEIF
ncbi:hypothetical protein L1049_010524 [Liquidambar formosana]|uniref:Reverse transcriptase domain-containing protein n=1 Tax=Liquidambar formosana TaxID=63359 RepID=A0AAP0NAE7_LIQFO